MIKNKFKNLKIVALAVSSLAFTFSSFAACITGFSVQAEEEGGEETSYYLCLSTENYRIKSANKMTKNEEGEYVLNDISLSSSISFYVSDNAGTRYLGSDNDNLTVDDETAYDYTVKFSPTAIYGENGDGWQDTSCHITWKFYTPAQYSVDVISSSTVQAQPLTYNPYNTAYDMYYISSIHLVQGQKIALTGAAEGSETHTIDQAGYYRIVYTPDKDVEGNIYRFDKDGNYGTGADYAYNFYIEQAAQYYVVFKEKPILQEGATGVDINGQTGYLLTRDEQVVGAEAYRTVQFFTDKSDYELKYYIYEKQLGGTFKKVDADNDEDTEVNKTTISDVGWHSVTLTEGDGVYALTETDEERNFHCWYAASNFNGYGYNESGEIDLQDGYTFQLLEEDDDPDDDFDEDNDQYVLYLTVTAQMLKKDDFTFFITDGDAKYKNGTEYITLNTQGTYKILFSKSKVYGRGRQYRYLLQDSEKDVQTVEISSADEWNAFAQKCNENADYSVNTKAYLTADIDFSKKTIVPIKSFAGALYGNYHTVKGVTLSGDDKTTDNSLFCEIRDNGRIECLTVEADITNKDGSYVGLVGKNYGTLYKVTFNGTVTGKQYVGGVVAYNGKTTIDDNSTTDDSNSVSIKGTVKECVNNATITGEVHVGGVAGYNGGDVLSSKNTGAVVVTTYKTGDTRMNAGGVVGYSIGRISDCENSGSVQSDSIYVGGIAGLCTGEIYFSTNNGTVNGEQYVGGIVGYYGTIQEEDANATQSYLGGLTYQQLFNTYFSDSGDDFEPEDGSAHALIYLTNHGTITANAYVGGVVGIANSTEVTIRCSLSDSSVKGEAGNYVGGIVGQSTGTAIEECFASGAIECDGLNAGNYVGGIAGQAGSVTACASNAYVNGTEYVGGIVGNLTGNTPTLTQCWANVLLNADQEANYQGCIAGNIEAYIAGHGTFSGTVKYNYFIGNQQGIAQQTYGAESDHAADRLTAEQLQSRGALSQYLVGFSTDKWLGGEKEATFPVLRDVEFFDEDVSKAYDADSTKEFDALFEAYGEKIKEKLDKYAHNCCIFVVEECYTEDPFDDDGATDYDNFKEIAVVWQYGTGEELKQITPVYAQKTEKGYIYEGDDARYFVTVNIPESVTESGVVYCTYREIVTTLSTEDGSILVEGDFDKDAKVEAVWQGNYRTLKFTLNGEEVNVGSAVVRVACDKPDKNYITVANGSNEEDVKATTSGNALVFTWQNGQYFRLQAKPLFSLPTWAWILIGVGGVLVVAGIMQLIIFGVRKAIKKKKAKKQAAKEVAEQEKEVAENK